MQQMQTLKGPFFYWQKNIILMLTKHQMRKKSFQISTRLMKHSLTQTRGKYTMQQVCRQTISKITLSKVEVLVSIHSVLLSVAQKRQLT
jgi:hypothetical protein